MNALEEPTRFDAVEIGGVPVLPAPQFSPFAQHWYVHGNDGLDANPGTKDKPKLTLAAVFTSSFLLPGDVIHIRGNISEHLTMPTGVPDLTIIGEGNRPRHADTHPLNGEVSGATWKSAGTNSPLCTVVCPGTRFVNILFAAHASNAAILLTRNGVEDATEIDSSHASIIGCRFASGGYGIRDTGGVFNVVVKNNVFGAVTEAILGVGNIGVGQLQWHITDNHFNNMTNGVKIAAHECIVTRNYFTDGGTPNTTYVLNMSNGGGRDNFIHDNVFQSATANFNTPDVVGNDTDVWARNISIDSTAAGVGTNTEWGKPA